MISPSREQTPFCTKCRYDLSGLCPSGLCPECGTSIAQSVRLCPRCDSRGLDPKSLPPTALEGVYACNICHGLGFEPGALKDAVEGEDRRTELSTVHDLAHQAGVNCARCRCEMKGIFIDAHTLVDRCEKCSFVWIDSTEFMAVVSMIRRNAGGLSVPKDVERFLDCPAEMAWLADKAREPNPIVETILSKEFLLFAAVTIARILLRVR